MYSDDWLRLGFQHGERVKVSTVADYVIWTDNKGCVAGITFNFEEADDYHYDLPIDEWMKFLSEVMKNTNFDRTSILLRKFLDENREIFAFEDVSNEYQINYNKIAFY